MTYKKFVAWCNQRACDGLWDATTFTICVSVMDAIRPLPFWKREKAWRKLDAEEHISEHCSEVDKCYQPS